MLLDVQSFGLTGRQAESALLDSAVVTQPERDPDDPNGAWYTSGIHSAPGADHPRLSVPPNSTGGRTGGRRAHSTPRPLRVVRAVQSKYKLADGTADRCTRADAAELLAANPCTRA